MKCSDAMVLGSTTCKMVPADWNSCALGAAGNAIGIEQGIKLGYWESGKPEFHAEPIKEEAFCFTMNFPLPIRTCCLPDGRERREHILDAWPWLRKRNIYTDITWYETIYRKFDWEVCHGTMSFEELIQFVRSVEPSCGECNKFNCSCAHDTALSEATEGVLAI